MHIAALSRRVWRQSNLKAWWKFLRWKYEEEGNKLQAMYSNVPVKQKNNFEYAIGKMEKVK